MEIFVIRLWSCEKCQDIVVWMILGQVIEKFVFPDNIGQNNPGQKCIRI